MLCRQKISDNKTKLKHWTGELKKLRKLHQKEAEDWGLEDQHSDSDSESEDHSDSDDMSDGDEADGAEGGPVEKGVEETKGGEGDRQGEEESEVRRHGPKWDGRRFWNILFMGWDGMDGSSVAALEQKDRRSSFIIHPPPPEQGFSESLAVAPHAIVPMPGGFLTRTFVGVGVIVRSFVFFVVVVEAGRGHGCQEQGQEEQESGGSRRGGSAGRPGPRGTRKPRQVHISV